jgi:hypothetical protein
MQMGCMYPLILFININFGDNLMKKNKRKNYYIVICIFFVLLGCFSGCSEKRDESRGFEPVSKTEAESFANQLIAKFKQGDKSQFFNAGTDIDAIVALCHFSGEEIPSIMKSPNDQERRAFADKSLASNHMFFDSLKSVELVEIKGKFGTFCAILDCKFDQTAKNSITNGPITDRKFPFTFLKKKISGEIIIAGIGN